MKIAFVPLEEGHFPLLLTWLMVPHVRKWWDSDKEWTPVLVQEKYGTYIDGYKLEGGIKKPIKAYIIMIDGCQVGYIQLYDAHLFEREGDVSLKELPLSLAAFDIFIGDPAYVGKAYSEAFMTQFLKEYVDPFFEACFVDPEKANIKAVKAYEKVGFAKRGEQADTFWMLRIK